ncbi:hypothetical protein Vretimale_7513 [Volvox reticuliferus]|uniref:Nuclear nucleic acid-binding protein C1D n=1 Tax=Volvox reticuliferus TaxID=1737510 RepID=A0A8J4LM73_9CHLO|nr:hypothetical protein Vretifemale_7572 [Volvox reticuliferus]GIM02673.1 hypothetical protein Vretimale_7513 [Volvox reticuliferus]
MSSTAAGVAPTGNTGAAGATTLKPLDPLVASLELPEDVQSQLEQFQGLVTELQKALQAAAAQAPTPGDLAAIPEPLERARLCMCIAKAVNALHHVYIRAQGRDPFTPVTAAAGATVGRQELDRIRQYDKKVMRAVSDAERRASRPVFSLDVAAASRFIDAAIPDLTEQQRRDLKRAAQLADAKRGGQDRGKGKRARQQPGTTNDDGPERRPVREQPQEGGGTDDIEEDEKEGETKAGKVTAQDTGKEEEEEEQPQQQAESQRGTLVKGDSETLAAGKGAKAKPHGTHGGGGGGGGGRGGRSTGVARGTTAAAAAATPSTARAAAEEFLAALASGGELWATK